MQVIAFASSFSPAADTPRSKFDANDSRVDCVLLSYPAVSSAIFVGERVSTSTERARTQWHWGVMDT